MSPPSRPLADPLSEVLSLLRPRSYAFRGVDAAGRWSIGFPAAEGLRCYALQTGECWMHVEGEAAPRRLEAGDCVLLARGQALRFGSEAGGEPIDALGLFATVEVGEVAVINGGGACRGAGGYFAFDGDHADLLLDLLPPVAHVRREADRGTLRGAVERLMDELRAPQPGGALLADHLAQMLFICALRLHLTEGAGAGWLGALADRRLNLALSAMHADLGRRWTLEDLAQAAGMSRSSFAARFAARVGEPPMAYLARWRMRVAADRLSRGAAISAVAPMLGYDSESAFGAAFKRVMGRPPRRFVAARGRVAA